MKNVIKQTTLISLLLLPTAAFAWKWADLWQTADQQGTTLLQAGKPEEASRIFANKDWQAVAQYRSGKYAQAFQKFSEKKTSDNQYNAGNAAAYMGEYQKAIDAYDKALALNPKNSDAITNREIVKKLLNKKQESKNDSSDKNEKDKKGDAKDKLNNNTSASQKNSDKNNKKDTEKQSAENKQQKDKGSADAAKEKTDNAQQSQADKGEQTPDNQQLNPKQQEEATAASRRLQEKNEDKNQLLRRIADDPGGLLRQKFLRDYYRRHVDGGNSDQGANNE